MSTRDMILWLEILTVAHMRIHVVSTLQMLQCFTAALGRPPIRSVDQARISDPPEDARYSIFSCPVCQAHSSCSRTSIQSRKIPRKCMTAWGMSPINPKSLTARIRASPCSTLTSRINLRHRESAGCQSKAVTHCRILPRNDVNYRNM